MVIKGITIKLHVKNLVGYDDFNQPIYEDDIEDVDNVLIGEPSSDDIVNDLSLYGKRAQYTLAIPKGDTHDWSNVEVEFFEQTFKTFGDVTQGIEDLIPLTWNKKVKVEKYE